MSGRVTLHDMIKKANYNFMNRKYKIWGFDFLYCCTLNNSNISREYIRSDTEQVGTFIREKSKQM